MIIKICFASEETLRATLSGIIIWFLLDPPHSRHASLIVEVGNFA